MKGKGGIRSLGLSFFASLFLVQFFIQFLIFPSFGLASDFDQGIGGPEVQTSKFLFPRSFRQRPRWKRYTIPGAICGDGSSYHIFIREGDPKRVVFDYMGGGACWSLSTCWGPTPMTWIHAIPFMVPFGGIFSSDPKVSALSHHTRVFFPYCTGDIFMADHTKRYLGVNVHHRGRRNLELSLSYLRDEKIIDLASVNQVILEGSSAGALAALTQIKKIEALIPPTAEKIALADAPGLHFGDDFWDKFTPELMRDFRESLAPLGMKIDQNSGNLAAQVKDLCRIHKTWRFGFLQGSRDIVMSALFGTISPFQHEKRVFGPEGLYQGTLDLADNCSSWVPRTSTHTFLMSGLTSRLKIGEISAMDFVKEVIGGGPVRNYRGVLGREEDQFENSDNDNDGNWEHGNQEESFNGN